jgi:hypothetical protein
LGSLDAPPLKDTVTDSFPQFMMMDDGGGAGDKRQREGRKLLRSLSAPRSKVE